jgi:FtsP/CotA-like multicopper oxidase with cupredoxin domain
MNFLPPIGQALDCLSLINCWGGNLLFPYSLGQRSLLVADVMQTPTARVYGLLSRVPAVVVGDPDLDMRFWALDNGADIAGQERLLLKLLWIKLDLAPPTAAIADEIDRASERVKATEWRDVVDDTTTGNAPGASALTSTIRCRSFDTVRAELRTAFQNHLAIAHASGLRRAS